MTLLCHTQKASFSPPSAAFQPSGPRRAGSQDSGGLLAASPGQLGFWDVRRCQGKPRQSFPKLGGLGRDPGRRRACAPPAAPRSQGSGEPGWNRTRIPGGPPSPCSQDSRGSSAVCLSWRLKVAAPHRALRGSAIFAHGSLQEGLQEAANRARGERPERGQEMRPKASFGEARGSYARGPGGKPSGGRLQRAPWPGAQAVASWSCLPAEVPAPAAAVTGAHVSSPPLLSGHWAVNPCFSGGSWPWPGPRSFTPAPSLRGGHLFQTTCCADIALERRRRLACWWRAVWRPPGSRKGFRVPLPGKGTPPRPLGRAVCFTPARVPGTQGVLGAPALWPNLGTSPGALSNLGGRMRQRSGLEAPRPNESLCFTFSEPPPPPRSPTEIFRPLPPLPSAPGES